MLVQGYFGLKKVEMEEAGVGDIVLLAGIPEVHIGDTLCDPNHIGAASCNCLKAPPTLSIEIIVNTSPFAGKDGKHITMNKIRDRLMLEKRANISLKIEEVEGKRRFYKGMRQGRIAPCCVD